jgi:hypothetical protein
MLIFTKNIIKPLKKITIELTDDQHEKNDEPSSKGTELNMGTTPFRDMGSTSNV